MTGTELARDLANAALTYQSSKREEDLTRINELALDAIAHVRQVGYGTVDHIVLSGILRKIADEIPSLAGLLKKGQWRWLR